ncbi:hypothetical protein MOB18_21805, partial [Bacillus inaquosorum]|uniref:hypothetical protein n=1 Tax=Bacillus inaquosorum TaxID=483913 RepID=UPI002281B9FB
MRTSISSWFFFMTKLFCLAIQTSISSFSRRITGSTAPGFLVSRFGRILLSAAARASGCLASISSFSYRITGAAAPGFLVSTFGRILLSAAARAFRCGIDL